MMRSGKWSGDRGMTSLSGNGMVSKADERVELIGTIEELRCHIGLIRAESSCPHFCAVLSRIQHTLGAVSEGVRASFRRETVPDAGEIAFLEQEIKKLRTELEPEVRSDEDEKSGKAGSEKELTAGISAGKAVPEAGREAATLELAAAVTRRAERALIAVDRRYGVRAESRQYLNRLAEYFDTAGRYRRRYPSWQPVSQRTDETQQKREQDLLQETTGRVMKQMAPGIGEVSQHFMGDTEEAIQQEVRRLVRQTLRQMGDSAAAHVQEISLEQAKKLMESVEEEAGRRGARAVICICNAHGNPVAVHVMDGAFLVSFDAARKKAYTAAAVKMPTLELARIAAPGETFYGVDRLDDGKITLIGGGVPLMKDGILCGSIGVSGGTGEEDHSLASYAVDIFNDLW